MTAWVGTALQIQAAQSPPVISSIPNQLTFPGVATKPVLFTVWDAQTPATGLQLSCVSTNPALVSPANVVFGGSGTNRNLTVLPTAGVKGQALITVTVTDERNDTASTSFVVNVADFTSINPGFQGLSMGKVSWADIDNDGDLDALITGMYAFNQASTVLYLNQGNGTFASIYSPFPHLIYSSVDWGDYDRDGNLDLLIAGNFTGNTSGTSQVFKGYGNSFFSYVASLNPVYFGSVGWGDFDNDGDVDALLGGRYSMYGYRNSSGVFSNANFSFPNGWYLYTAWGDYDNDGDLDWATSASSSGGTRIFRQDSPGNFSITNTLTTEAFQSAAWADSDNDGDLDLVAMDTGTTRIYRNDGNDVFAQRLISVPGTSYGSLACGDYDNDGDVDLLVSGSQITRIYRNDGPDIFTNVWTAPEELGESSVAWGDYDNDGDLDILINGVTGGASPVRQTLIYRNDGANPNSAPSAPGNLSVQKDGRRVRMAWAAATDAEQGGGLTYNVRLGSTPGGIEVVSPNSSLATGKRRIPALGNCGTRLACDITNLTAGTYYWSVQAIDNTFAGSAFSAQQSFTISPPVITNHPQNQVVLAGQTATLTVSATGTPPLLYQWRFNGININGATNSSLIFTDAHYTNQGVYSVEVMDVVGSALSSNALLTVHSPPIITLQPRGQTLMIGGNAVFSVGAIGDEPFTYQWYKGEMPLTGRTEASLILNGLIPEDEGSYSVRITNAYGFAISEVVSLNLYSAGVGLRSASAGSPVDMVYDEARDILYITSGGSVLRYSLKSNAFMTPFVVGNSLAGLDLSPNGHTLAVAERSLPFPTNTWIYLIDLRTGLRTDVGFEKAYWESNIEWLTYGGDGAILMTSDFTGGSAPVPLRRYEPDTGAVQILMGIGERARLTASADGSVIAIGEGSISSGNIFRYQVSSRQVVDSAACNQFSWIHPGVNHNATQYTYSMDHATYVLDTNMNHIHTFGGSYLGERPVGVVYHPSQNLMFLTWGNTYEVRVVEATNFTEVARYNLGMFFGTGSQASYRTKISRDGTLLMVAGGSSVNFIRMTAAPPTISVNPSSTVGGAGNNVSFTVGAIGTPPFAYQWQFNGTNLPGANSSSLQITNVEPWMAGNYRAIVFNQAGSVTSAVATLTWAGGPYVTQHPTNTTVAAGDPVSLSVAAIGNLPLFYQWRLDGTNVGGRGQGITSYQVGNAQAEHAGEYTVVVDNSQGSTTSAVAVVTVVPSLPLIASHPGSITNTAGEDVTFGITAKGTEPMFYEWFFNGTRMDGEAGTSLFISNLQADRTGDYVVHVSNSVGVTTSAPIALTITPSAPVFTLSPVTRSVPIGAEAVFTGAAKGTEPIFYQWTQNGMDLPGATTTSLVLANVQSNNAGSYTLIASNSVSAVPSVAANLNILAPPGFLWARSGGGTGHDQAECVAVDGEGNVCVAGTFFDTAAFGPTNVVSTGAADIFVAKYDPLGVLLWVRSAGGLGGDVPYGIAADAAGNVYVTGFLGSDANFGEVALTNVVGDVFIAKYDTLGNLAWATNAGGVSNDQGNGIAVDSFGNVLVTGYFNATAYFGTNVVVGSGGKDVFVAKYDANGNALWARKGGGGSHDEALAITGTTDGRVVATGFCEGSVVFGSTTSTNIGVKDLFVCSYDANGNFQWFHRGGGTGADMGRNIAAGPGGTVYVTGDFTGTASFGSVSLAVSGSASSTDVLLEKLNSAGQVVWAVRAGSTSSDMGQGVAVDEGGNAYVAGEFVSTASFGSNNIASSGGWNVFVAMCTSAGEWRWVRQAGGPETDTCGGISVGKLGDVFLAGSYFVQPATFGHVTLTSEGGWDAFTAKLSAFNAAAPPILTLGPISQVVGAGANVLFESGYIGAGTVTYQWRRDGTNITGGTHASLTLTNATSIDAGAYSVVLSNNYGAVTSAVATLNVTVEPDFLWALRAGGTENDEALAVTSDTNGNTYVAGTFSGTTIVGGVPFTSFGGEDIFIAKFDSSRNLTWARQAGGNGLDRANSIAVDSGGTVLVGGQFSSSATFGGGQHSSIGGTDIFLARYNPAGGLMWATTGGGAGDDGALGVCFASNGTFRVTGYYYNAGNFGGASLPSGGSNNMFVAMGQTAGPLLWARAASGSGNEFGRSVATDRLGNTYVAGGFTGSANFSGMITGSERDSDAFLARYDTSGNLLWVHKAKPGSSLVSTNNYSDEALGVAVDSDGNPYITGYYNNQILFGSLPLVAASVNKPDLFLAKLSNAGEVLWARTAGGAGADYGQCVATDPGGNAFVGGSFQSIAYTGSGTLRSAGESDAWLAMYDANGLLIKARRAGGSAADTAMSVAYDGQGAAVAAGNHGAPAAFGSIPLANAGSKDIFVTAVQMYDPNQPPVFTSAPQDTGSSFGSNVVLSAGVSTVAPVSYQWLKDGAVLTGATGVSLRLTNLQYGLIGDYSVLVSNTFGWATSQAARVTIDLTPEVLWTQKLGGTSEDSALAVEVDANTNIYIAGQFSGTILLGTSNLVSSGGTDIFLAKYGPSGTLDWIRRAGSTGNDSAQAVTVDSSGNVFITGYFSGNYGVTNVFGNVQSFFVAKYTASGGLAWVETSSNPNANYSSGSSLKTDGSGNIYVTGGYYRFIAFDQFTLSLPQSLQATNCFVAKFNNDGQAQWAYHPAITNQPTSPVGGGYLATCRGAGIALDLDNNVLLTGHFYGIADFGGGPISGTNSFFNGTCFIAKLSSGGVYQWARKGGTNGFGYGQSIVGDDLGNVYATSYKRDYGDGILLSKYDSAGNLLWYRPCAISGATGDYISAGGLALDQTGNPVVTGGPTGAATIEGMYLVTQGFVVKYRKADGAPFWIQKLGRMGNAAAMDEYGNAYLAGRFQGTAVFGTSSNMTSAGLNDAFLVKMGVRAPSTDLQPTNQVVLAGSNATLRAGLALGTGPLGYQWQLNGSNLIGATSSALQLNGFAPGQAGRYSVVIQNSSGSITGFVGGVGYIPILVASPLSNGVRLSWGGDFTLQAANHVTGPFVDVGPVPSPFTNLYSGPDTQRFFRLRVSDPMLSGAAAPASGFAISVPGSPGRSYSIQASTNLSDWLQLGTNVAPFTMVDTNSISYPRRFYRALLEP